MGLVANNKKNKPQVEHEPRSAHGCAVYYQQAYFRCSQGAWKKIMMHFTKILIIIALTRNNGGTNFNRRGIFVSKKVKFEVLFTWPLIFHTGKNLSKTICEYLKNLFSLICGFRFLVLDSGFQFPGFRIAPSLTVCLLYIQFTHRCYPA